MKKEYIKPEIIIEEIELEDVIAASGTFGGSQDGDSSVSWPWAK